MPAAQGNLAYSARACLRTGMSGSAFFHSLKRSSYAAPIALDRARRDLQHLADFFHGQPAKETHLDDLGFSRVNARQVDQGLVERHEIGVGIPPGAMTTASSSGTC